MEANPDFGITHGYNKLIDFNGCNLDKIAGRPGSLNVKHGNVIPRIVGNFTLMTSSVMIRRDIIKDLVSQEMRVLNNVLENL